jgi:hypothetical protein
MSTDFGSKPELKWLPVDRLSVDHRYQRTLESERSQRLVARIAEKFRWSAFQAVLATEAPKGGGWLIIDGQHRVEAARQCGIKAVPAVVVDAKSLEEQAAAFVQANTDRVAVNPFALHRARVQGGDPAAVAVNTLCKAAGVEIAPYPIPADKLKPGQTLALATIARLPRLGEDVAALALKTVAGAYRDRGGALRAPVIQAVALLLKDVPKPERAGLAASIRAHLARTDPARLATDAYSAKKRNGGTEVAATSRLIRDAARREQQFAARASDPSSIQPPSREQLMRGR